jgi:hypothetical protein
MIKAGFPAGGNLTALARFRCFRHCPWNLQVPSFSSASSLDYTPTVHILYKLSSSESWIHLLRVEHKSSKMNFESQLQLFRQTSWRCLQTRRTQSLIHLLSAVQITLSENGPFTKSLHVFQLDYMTYQPITRMRVTRQQLNLPHCSSLITN